MRKRHWPRPGRDAGASEVRFLKNSGEPTRILNEANTTWLTNSTSDPAGTGKLCPKKTAHSTASKPKKLACFGPSFKPLNFTLGVLCRHFSFQ